MKPEKKKFIIKNTGEEEKPSRIIEQLASYLGNLNFIDFAILFGSFAEDRANNLSDIDIGLFTNKDIPLLELGALTAKLESVLKRNVDMILLNDLYKKRPVFTYEIISNGKIIFCNNEDKLVEFRKKTFLYFMDTKHLIAEINNSFKERMSNNKFGERNYVRAG